MSGRRHEMDSIGESYEDFVVSVLGRIATLTRVGTKQDFGTDTYCQPRISAGTRIESVTELCLLQIKGGIARLEYGGLDKKRGTWKSHEFDWLKNLWAPLYLATVDAQHQKVNLYSLWAIWWVMWQCDTPFKIVLSCRDSDDSEFEYSPPLEEKVTEGQGYGDGQIWSIDLGPPLIQLTHQDLNNPDFRDRVLNVFRYWIRVDRQTIARFHSKIPLVEANYRWNTNQIPSARQELLMMDGRPGMNIESLVKALVPSLLALGAHLQHQKNREVFRLLPLLEWIQSNEYGNLITPQLLDNLVRAHREGVCPSEHL